MPRKTVHILKAYGPGRGQGAKAERDASGKDEVEAAFLREEA